MSQGMLCFGCIPGILLAMTPGAEAQRLRKEAPQAAEPAQHAAGPRAHHIHLNMERKFLHEDTSK